MSSAGDSHIEQRTITQSPSLQLFSHDGSAVGESRRRKNNRKYLSDSYELSSTGGVSPASSVHGHQQPLSLDHSIKTGSKKGMNKSKLVHRLSEDQLQLHYTASQAENHSRQSTSMR